MSKEAGKQAWVTPRLEQIAMVDTAMKGPSTSEDVVNGRFMATSNNS